MIDVARSADGLARQLLENYNQLFAVGLVNLANIFNPQRIVVDGGPFLAGELILEPARQYSQTLQLPLRGEPALLPARYPLEDRWSQKLSPRFSATAASWAIYGLAMQWNRDKSKKKPSAEQFAEQILPLIAVNLAVAQAG